jgi:hypothetical protein
MSALNTTDNLPHYNLRKGDQSYEDFLKGFTEIIELKTVLSPLTPGDLADLYAEVERKDIRVELVLMNSTTYSDVRKWGRDILDIETDKENLKKGLMATIWGAYIMVTVKIPDGVVIAISEEDKKICAMMKLGQEKYYGLEGINELKNKAHNLTRDLVDVYAEMEKMVDRVLLSLKNK